MSTAARSTGFTWPQPPQSNAVPMAGDQYYPRKNSATAEDVRQ
jgi:hypothetical protein